MKNLSRSEIGISGIDNMIEGGLPEDSIIAVEGPAGVGKSILAMQFLLEGAKKNEKGLYINLEEPRQNIDRMITTFKFGKDFKIYEKKKKINCMCLDHDTFLRAYEDIFEKIHNNPKIKRVVIDSFNCFFTFSKYGKMTGNDLQTRKVLLKAFETFRRKGLTTMMILEKIESSTVNRISRFFVDGIIDLDFLSLGSIERRIFIPKMRWTSQYDSSLPFEITEDGIIVKQETDYEA